MKHAVPATLLFAILAASAHAAPTVTAAGAAIGFTISTFASSLPNTGSFGFGPFGVTTTANGNVLVSDYDNNIRYAFSDVDGQTPGSALSSTSNNGSSPLAYTNAGGLAYGAIASPNGFVQFNNNGTVNHQLTGVTPGPYLGMWTNPINGHIIATSQSGLIDIDPLANGGLGTYRVINNVFADGISVSPDGLTVYAEVGGGIQGYSIATGLTTFAFLSIPGGPDGTGIISSSDPSLNGRIVVNRNDGIVSLIDPVTRTFIDIASLGANERGDFTAADVSNGTLFLDGTSLVARLACGAGCSIGSAPTVPEPASVVLFGTIATLAFFKLRRKQAA